MFVKISRVSTSNILLNWVCICYFPFNYQPEVSLRTGFPCGLGKKFGQRKNESLCEAGGGEMGESEMKRRAARRPTESI